MTRDDAIVWASQRERKSRMIKEFLSWLNSLSSADAANWWALCERPQWMLWMLHQGKIKTIGGPRSFACDVAERAMQLERHKGRDPDPILWETVRIARAYCKGEARRQELVAAFKKAKIIYIMASKAANISNMAYAVVYTAHAVAHIAAKETSRGVEEEWQTEHRWQAARLRHYVPNLIN